MNPLSLSLEDAATAMRMMNKLAGRRKFTVLPSADGYTVVPVASEGFMKFRERFSEWENAYTHRNIQRVARRAVR
jgi:hypothetical protein